MKANVEIQSYDYEGCCKAQIIYGFGNGHQGESESDTISLLKADSGLKKYTKEDYLKDTIDAIHIRINFIGPGIKLITAITTSTQHTAAKALKAVGFSKNGRPVMVTKGHYLQHWSLDKNKYTPPKRMPKYKHNIRRYW
jgi:hypothetical protein